MAKSKKPIKTLDDYIGNVAKLKINKELFQKSFRKGGRATRAEIVGPWIDAYSDEENAAQLAEDADSVMSGQSFKKWSEDKPARRAAVLFVLLNLGIITQNQIITETGRGFFAEESYFCSKKDLMSLCLRVEKWANTTGFNENEDLAFMFINIIVKNLIREGIRTIPECSMFTEHATNGTIVEIDGNKLARSYRVIPIGERRAAKMAKAIDQVAIDNAVEPKSLDELMEALENRKMVKIVKTSPIVTTYAAEVTTKYKDIKPRSLTLKSEEIIFGVSSDGQLISQ